MEQKKKRGRPPISDEAMTAAERQRRWREQARITTVGIKISAETADVLNRYCELTGVSKPTQIATLMQVMLADWAEDVERRWPEIVESINALKQAKEQRND